jgi:hypothetical protein
LLTWAAIPPAIFRTGIHFGKYTSLDDSGGEHYCLHASGPCDFLPSDDRSLTLAVKRLWITPATPR